LEFGPGQVSERLTWIEKDDEFEAGVFTGVQLQSANSSDEFQQLVTDAAEADANQNLNR